MVINYQEKIIALWTVFLLGTLFHTQLGLMPLFHGQSIAINAYGTSSIFWWMLAFFMLPMVAIVATAFLSSRHYRATHFGLTIFYTVMNFLHVALDLGVRPIAWYQIGLMVILFLVGLLLNLVAFQWLHNHNYGGKWQVEKT